MKPSRADHLELGLGALVAALVLSVPALEVAFGGLMIVIHELGHAAVGWLFAYPSLPAFDLRYGGGVTRHMAPSGALQVAVYAALLAALWLLRRNPGGRLAAAGALVGYALAAHTSLHRVLMLAAGHGAELALAGVFLYRALTGAAVLHPQERPLYAGVGFYMLFYDLRFAARLLTSAEARLRYQQAKGGGHWMDFSRIASEHLGVSLEVVAVLFLLACLATPALAYAAATGRDRWGARARRLLALGG